MKEILPIILGSDINAYSIARLFYDEYEVKSLVLSTEIFRASRNTKILTSRIINNFHDKDVFLRELNNIYELNKNKKLILISCGETYSKLMYELKAELSNFIIPYYTDKEMAEKLLDKEGFYKICEEHGLAYPKTYIYQRGEELNIPFDFPVILKPASTVEYQKIDFPEKEKVYILQDLSSVEELVDKIYANSYKGNLIIQEYIPGDDSSMYVLNCYSNKLGEVKMMSLGKILIEEKAPLFIGNYAAITDAYNEELCLQVKEFLEKINYVGISNFDIKYDYRDGKYKFFEINLRQGRSSFYVYGGGANFARLIVDEYVHGKDLEFTMTNKPFLYLNLYKLIAKRFIDTETKKAIKSKPVYNPFLYKKDKNLKRSISYLRMQLGQLKYLHRYNR